jgi:hypothetical protein
MNETAKKISDLATKGYSAREIARKVKVSRQRVYQLAKENGISLPHPVMGSPASQQRPLPKSAPKARVVLTGGVDVPLSHSVVGIISEFLVAADLMARDFRVYLPVKANRGHDIIAEAWNGALLTFEVRSAYRTLDGGTSFNRKSEDRADYYALVVTGEPVAYKPDLLLNAPPNKFQTKGKGIV